MFYLSRTAWAGGREGAWAGATPRGRASLRHASVRPRESHRARRRSSGRARPRCRLPYRAAPRQSPACGRAPAAPRRSAHRGRRRARRVTREASSVPVREIEIASNSICDVRTGAGAAMSSALGTRPPPCAPPASCSDCSPIAILEARPLCVWRGPLPEAALSTATAGLATGFAPGLARGHALAGRLRKLA